MANFTDILNKPAESIEKPKVKPAGSYVAVVTGPHKQREVKGKDGTEYPVIAILVKTVQAMDDVDQAALAEAGGVGNSMNIDFFLTSADGTDNSWRLAEFLEFTLGIEKTGKSLAQMLSEIPGKQLIVTIKHEIFTNKQGEPEIAARIGSTAKA